LDTERGERNYEWVIEGTVARDGNCLLYLKAKLFSHQLQLLVELTVKEVYLFHVFLTTTINRFNGFVGIK
jgi:hypothetical protein